MQQLRLLMSVFLLTFIGFFSITHASEDIITEQDIAEKITASLNTGKIIELKAGENTFTGVYQQDLSGKNLGAVLIVHDLENNADHPEVIRPLRTQLSEHGWSTLAIQMPYVQQQPYEKLNDEIPLYIQRISSGLQYLRSEKHAFITIIGHGFGGALSIHYLVTEKATPNGLVTISLSGRAYTENLYPVMDLEKLTLPMLDIFGSQDFTDVVSTKRARAIAARKGAQLLTKSRSLTSEQITYRQIELTGADHAYTGFEGTLYRRIHGWLVRQYEAEMKGK